MNDPARVQGKALTKEDGSDPTGQSLDLPITGITAEDDEQRARTEAIRADTKSRRFMVGVIAFLFFSLNAAVMLFIWKVFASDLEHVKIAPDTARIVTTEVLMSLVAATVVQVGVAVIAIVSYLFPKGQGSKVD